MKAPATPGSSAEPGETPTIVLTGAGSGGHITPLLAVAAELKRRRPDVRLVYIGQRGDKLGDLPAKDSNINAVYSVRAGKFRRYHDEGLKQLLDLPTQLRNLRDLGYVLIGLYQSWRLLARLQPAVIFIKGGYLGLPVGLVAGWRHIPYITHDSDAIPGLTNRLLAKRAAKHAVALPPAVYNYPASKTVMTGIPLRAEFVAVTAALRRRYRLDIGVPEQAKLLFVIGGGLGAQHINQAVAEAVPHLLREFPDLYVVHGVGRANETAMKLLYDQNLKPAEQGRLQLQGYLEDVYRYSGAADLIVTRAGATNLAEFALQGRACLVVPSPFLAGGHQLKNAQYLQDQQAAVVLNEADLTADPNRLARQVSHLLTHPEQRRKLEQQLATFAKPQATVTLARLILEEAELTPSAKQ